MRFVRSGRRVAVAAVSLSALLVAAACGSSSSGAGSGTGSSAPAVDFTKQGDIEVWQGKDTSGNFPKLIAQFNSQHPNGKVTFHELPDSADQQRQQMIQNTQIKNPAMAVLSVDVVWTSEFAAKGYVVPLPADQFPTDRLPAVRGQRGDLLQQALRLPVDLRRRPAVLPQGPARQVRHLQAADDLRRDEGRLRQDQGGREQLQARLLRRPVQQVRGPHGELRRGRAQRRRRHRGRRRQAERGDARGRQGPADPGRLVQERRHPQGRHHLAGGERPAGVRGRPADLPPQLGLRVQPRARPTRTASIKGKFDVAPLPGITGPGVSSLGGHNYAIAANADEQGHGGGLPEVHEPRRRSRSATRWPPRTARRWRSSTPTPTWSKKFPFMPTQLKSIQGADPAAQGR